MSTVLGWLTSRLAGPILGGVAGLLLLALVFVTVSAKATESSLRGEVAALHKEIDDPTTGLRARLGQCHANVDRLTAAVSEQSAAVDRWKAVGSKATADAKAALDRARRESAAAAGVRASVLGAKPGADRCVSALDILKGVAG